MSGAGIIKLKIGLLFVFVIFSGCSLLGNSQWTPYQVTVSVKGELGQAVSNAKLESSEIKETTVDGAGLAVVQFRSAGLHVVTISAPGKITKQIKVSLPLDENKLFSVGLINER